MQSFKTALYTVMKRNTVKMRHIFLVTFKLANWDRKFYKLLKKSLGKVWRHPQYFLHWYRDLTFNMNSFSIADNDSIKKRSTCSIDHSDQSIREEKMDSAIKTISSFFDLISPCCSCFLSDRQVITPTQILPWVIAFSIMWLLLRK